MLIGHSGKFMNGLKSTSLLVQYIASTVELAAPSWMHLFNLKSSATSGGSRFLLSPDQ
jgi:hypothetical protein